MVFFGVCCIFDFGLYVGRDRVRKGKGKGVRKVEIEGGMGRIWGCFGVVEFIVGYMFRL